jgi:hypothetical protein
LSSFQTFPPPIRRTWAVRINFFPIVAGPPNAAERLAFAVGQPVSFIYKVICDTICQLLLSDDVGARRIADAEKREARGAIPEGLDR